MMSFQGLSRQLPFLLKAFTAVANFLNYVIRCCLLHNCSADFSNTPVRPDLVSLSFRKRAYVSEIDRVNGRVCRFFSVLSCRRLRNLCLFAKDKVKFWQCTSK